MHLADGLADGLADMLIPADAHSKEPYPPLHCHLKPRWQWSTALEKNLTRSQASMPLHLQGRRLSTNPLLVSRPASICATSLWCTSACMHQLLTVHENPTAIAIVVNTSSAWFHTHRR